MQNSAKNHISELIDSPVCVCVGGRHAHTHTHTHTHISKWQNHPEVWKCCGKVVLCPTTFVYFWRVFSFFHLMKFDKLDRGCSLPPCLLSHCPDVPITPAATIHAYIFIFPFLSFLYLLLMIPPSFDFDFYLSIFSYIKL